MHFQLAKRPARRSSWRLWSLERHWVFGGLYPPVVSLFATSTLHSWAFATLKAWYTYLKTKAVNTTNATQIGAYNLANWYSNEPLLRRPKHSGGFSIGQYKDAYTINFDGIYTGGRWDFENSSTRKWNKNFWDFNLYGDYSIRRNQENNGGMRVFINIENVFNDKRQEVLNFTSPGRSIMTGIKANL